MDISRSFLLPVASVLDTRSDPAKSTRHNLLDTVLSVNMEMVEGVLAGA